jgi:hypothetical protein
MLKKMLFGGAVALTLVGGAFTAATPAMAQVGFGFYLGDEGYYGGRYGGPYEGYRARGWDEDNTGYVEVRPYRPYRRYDRSYRYPGGYNPSGCYYDEGGGRYYSCDAGGNR